MKKYLVVGNPIEHSLSPILHNYWIKNNNIKATYDKKKLSINDIEGLINLIRKKEIDGANVTLPFKNLIIPYLDELSHEAESTQSVNTIYLKNNKIIGHNTDISGFEFALKDVDFNIEKKKILILGAGGVVPSIVFALNKMDASQITISNRTKNKAENLKKLFKNLSIVEWGLLPYFDMIINATSVGLKETDFINLDFSKIEKGKLFYDVIYNPLETNFLKEGKKLGNKTENGKKMFIYQAAESFKIWHGIKPQLNDELNSYLNK